MSYERIWENAAGRSRREVMIGRCDKHENGAGLESGLNLAGGL
jgi:hypothetical protein